MQLLWAWGRGDGLDGEMNPAWLYFIFGENWVIVYRNVYVLGFKRIFCVTVEAMRFESVREVFFLCVIIEEYGNVGTRSGTAKAR